MSAADWSLAAHKGAARGRGTPRIGSDLLPPSPMGTTALGPTECGEYPEGFPWSRPPMEAPPGNPCPRTLSLFPASPPKLDSCGARPAGRRVTCPASTRLAGFSCDDPDPWVVGAPEGAPDGGRGVDAARAEARSSARFIAVDASISTRGWALGLASFCSAEGYG